jgi:hypothetical protein
VTQGGPAPASGQHMECLQWHRGAAGVFLGTSAVLREQQYWSLSCRHPLHLQRRTHVPCWLQRVCGAQGFSCRVGLRLGRGLGGQDTCDGHVAGHHNTVRNQCVREELDVVREGVKAGDGGSGTGSCGVRRC